MQIFVVLRMHGRLSLVKLRRDGHVNLKHFDSSWLNFQVECVYLQIASVHSSLLVCELFFQIAWMKRCIIWQFIQHWRCYFIWRFCTFQGDFFTKNIGAVGVKSVIVSGWIFYTDCCTFYLFSAENCKVILCTDSVMVCSKAWFAFSWWFYGIRTVCC